MPAPRFEPGSLTQLVSDFRAEDSEATTADTVLRNALEVLDDAEMASLTILRRHHTFQTLGATDPVAAGLDELQYELNEGPCVQSAEGGDWFRSGDIASDSRWPRWGPEAAARGVNSLLSVQMDSKGEPVGALNLYSTRPNGFADREQIEIGILYGVQAAQALNSARLVEGLEMALGSRHEIGMAQGILMERFKLTVDQSFAVLRRLSQHTNRKLREVAGEIVRTGALPDLTCQEDDPANLPTVGSAPAAD